MSGHPLPPPRAILFDMDGVLVRSWEAWFRVVEDAGRLFRGSPVTREEFAPTFGQGTAADVRVFKLNCTTAELDRFYFDNFKKHLGQMWINPDAKPVLEALKARGIRRGVVTNTVRALTEEVLKAAGVRDLFDSLSCADMVARAKPAPDLVLHGLSQLQLAPSDAWFVGDSKYDREAGKAAGVHFIGLDLDGGDRRIGSLRDLLATL